VKDAVGISKLVKQRDASELRLTDEQLAEVRRRRAKNDQNRVSFDEVFARFRLRGN